MIFQMTMIKINTSMGSQIADKERGSNFDEPYLLTISLVRERMREVADVVQKNNIYVYNIYIYIYIYIYNISASIMCMQYIVVGNVV